MITIMISVKVNTTILFYYIQTKRIKINYIHKKVIIIIIIIKRNIIKNKNKKKKRNAI